MGGKLFYLAPPVLYACLIFYLSSLSRIETPVTFENSDKIYHLLEYAGLALLVLRAIKRDSKEIVSWKPFIAGLIGCVLYALSDEIHQYFVPGRECALGDWAADTIGIMISGVLYICLHPRS